MTEPITMTAAKEAQIREIAEGLPDFTNTKLLIAEIDALRAALSRARAPQEGPVTLSKAQHERRFGDAVRQLGAQWAFDFLAQYCPSVVTHPVDAARVDAALAVPPALSHALEAGDETLMGRLNREYREEQAALRSAAEVTKLAPDEILMLIRRATECGGEGLAAIPRRLLAGLLSAIPDAASPAARPETAESETKALAFDAFWLGWRTRDESGGKSSAHIADAGWIIKRYLDAYKYGSRSPAAPEATQEGKDG